MAQNYFEKMEHKWQDVTIVDGQVNAKEFIEAAVCFTSILTLLGGVVFDPVKNDMLGNIKQMEDWRLTDPEKHANLQEMVRLEMASGKGKMGVRCAANGLTWFKRGMEFMVTSFQRSLNNETEELSVSFQKGYDTTLSKHHNFMMRPVFYLAVKACPYRKKFFETLAQGADMDKLMADAREYFDAFQKLQEICTAFTAEQGLEKK
eukprot:Lithocolla_globosa_v1_NODE_2372_length_2032_cov_3.563480.p2 type:complete len:205 gc:universal NODE_2372_length_2032_cov_3.563480:696-82(-)